MTAMTDPLPLSQVYNLARLGNAGDVVEVAADEAQRAAIARWADVLWLENFAARVEIRKLAPTRFGLNFTLKADVAQACVVTLEPVPAHLEHSFSRELVFSGPPRRKAAQPKSVAESPAEVVLDSLEDEGPEEIESLHYDLAGPLLEEFVLVLEPYPRCPGVAFEPPGEGLAPPESPFAVLKGLKPGR
ncbi:MAG: hypothetical protein RJB58_23 [Pseudomonadota bacterium]|jgi:hypothetical protein